MTQKKFVVTAEALYTWMKRCLSRTDIPWHEKEDLLIEIRERLLVVTDGDEEYCLVAKETDE